MKYSLRRLMRFSIRDLMWLIVVVTLMLGWWVDRSRLATDAREMWNFFLGESEADPYAGEMPLNRSEELRRRYAIKPQPNSSAPTQKQPEN